MIIDGWMRFALSIKLAIPTLAIAAGLLMMILFLFGLGTLVIGFSHSASYFAVCYFIIESLVILLCPC